MIIKTNLKSYLSAILIVLLFALITGCAAKRSFWGDTKTGLTLEYRMPQDQTLIYQFSSNLTQDLKVWAEWHQIELMKN